ncbi:hypothetical protein [Streptomyces olindensis]|uniref:hypothetical protein n=1 Tax=Streptomyces olindensis TaxID=358823 RepID=UPI0036508086
MRRTTDPGSPALTFASLPNVFRGRSLPLKHSEQYSSGYGNGIEPWTHARGIKKKASERPDGDVKMTEKLTNKRYGMPYSGQLHVHLPLHLLYASETMVPHHRRIAPTANSRECLAWGRMDRPCSSR